MKKSIIALAVSSFAVASANAAPQSDTFYVGAKAGWASFHDGIKQLDAKHYNSPNGKVGYGINRNYLTYGGFVGYQISENFAAEAGYEFFGRTRGTQKREGSHKSKKTFNHRAHGAVLSLKAGYPVIDNLDLFGRVGVALVNSSYKTVDIANYMRTSEKRFQSSLVLGAGLEYEILPELSARVEYQWLNNVGKIPSRTLDRVNTNKNNNGHTNIKDYRPDIGAVTASLTYRFGQSAKPVEQPATIIKRFAFSSDVLFDFGKANLKSEAAATLDAANDEINKLGLSSATIQVNGFTDRIGKDEPNLKLSQRRAESVANYLVSRGVNQENITAVGYGKANPVTGSTCDAVKGRQALIACLAPDRRVELQVKGTKSISM